MSGLSFRAYIKRIWKALELVAILLYVLGMALHLMLVFETGGRFNAMPIDPVNTVQQTLLRMADVFYGLSLFLFFYRLLEAFTADISIGPLVIMVQTMLVKDLLPFLALFIVSLVSFSILQWIVAFKNTASPFALINLRTLFDALQMAYFQIFGEYSLDSLTGSGEKSFRDQPSRERQLKHWERLRFWDYQRYVLFGRSRRKNQTTKAVSVRTMVLSGQGGSMNAQLASNIQSFQQSATENIQAILSKTSRVEEVERKTDQLLKMFKGLQDEVIL
ncbi:unnamed protein product [Echinostoma caproni]|uniref:Ion_trans domain-containing protein n=1 Tax=Echinostoma caproni TaxID=27848 RepID=A0A183B6J8_9TREM|nr:unnamed protein product [Echinostoma caproni]